MAERAGKLAQDRVADHHRRQLAARQHVAPDRQAIAREVLEDPLIEALIPAAQERQRRFSAELLDQSVVETRPPGVSATTRRRPRSATGSVP